MSRKTTPGRSKGTLFDMQLCNRIDRFVHECEKASQRFFFLLFFARFLNFFFLRLQKGDVANLYDVDLVVDWLRVNFVDYARKKKVAFDGVCRFRFVIS